MPFGTLRSPNNPNAADATMTILKALIAVDPITGLGNTVLAQGTASGTGVEVIYIEQKAELMAGNFPALLLMTGQQTAKIAGGPAYEAESTIIAVYYNRWDRSPLTIDAIHTAMRQDLQRMQSNLESNQGLAYQRLYHAMSITPFVISGYDQELDERVPDVALVKCSLTMTIHSLPYGTFG